MSFAWKGLLALLWLLVVPAAAGALLFRNKEKPTLTDRFFAGYLLLFSLAELLTLLMMFLNLPLQSLVACYGTLVGLLAIGGAMRTLQLWRPCKQAFVTNLRSTSLFFWAALLLIAIQIAIVVIYAHFDADDALYVGTATTAVETNSIFRVNTYSGNPYRVMPSRYILSPFPIFLAIISQLSGGLHPAIMAHTILPAVFLICAYLVVYQLARKWFAGDSAAIGIFLFLSAMLCWFSAYSTYNAGNFQMIRLWQGKALLAAFMLPLVFYLSLSTTLEKQPQYSWLLLGMANLSCCLLSSMGIILAPLMMGIFIFLGLLRFRSLKRTVLGLLCCAPSLILGAVYILIK